MGEDGLRAQRIVSTCAYDETESARRCLVSSARMSIRSVPVRCSWAKARLVRRQAAALAGKDIPEQASPTVVLNQRRP
jgi:hypothetical protein